MNVLKSKVKTLVENKDLYGLHELLSKEPNRANEGITIPFDRTCRIKAHPLHRICDAVFVGKITDNEAVGLAKVFLKHGANIDGNKDKNDGTPLLAAASLHAEQTGIFYIENGADVHYTYTDGASALHWAAFCGRDKLVKRLIKAKAAIDEPDTEHKSTPLGWALHALMTNDKLNTHNQVSCMILLLQAGASLEKLSSEMNNFLHELTKSNLELQSLLNNKKEVL